MLGARKANQQRLNNPESIMNPPPPPSKRQLFQRGPMMGNSQEPPSKRMNVSNQGPNSHLSQANFALQMQQPPVVNRRNLPPRHETASTVKGERPLNHGALHSQQQEIKVDGQQPGKVDPQGQQVTSPSQFIRPAQRVIDFQSESAKSPSFNLAKKLNELPFPHHISNLPFVPQNLVINGQQQNAAQTPISHLAFQKYWIDQKLLE